MTKSNGKIDFNPMKRGVNDLISGLTNVGSNGTTSVKGAKEAGAAATNKNSVVVGINPYKKYSCEAIQGRVVMGVFRYITGLNDPKIKNALAGSMKKAALMFVGEPSLANTPEGAEKMWALLQNVEGFAELA